MIFLERFARPLLLLHAVAAGVLVGASTHHLLQCRRYLRGVFPRVDLEKLYVVVAAIAYAITFTIGLCEYPAYKVRVRAEYFDAPAAIEADGVARQQAARIAGSPIEARTGPRDLSWVGRLFDIKEHWAALGMAAALALLALSRFAHPAEEPRFAVVYVGLSALVCSAAWMGTLVGLATASYRAVGGSP